MSVPSTQKPKRDFLTLLEQNRDEIAKVLPAHVPVDRVCRVARSAYMTDAYVQRCSPASILLAVSKACELGLEPGGARKHAYLVPFKDECTLIVGFQGMLELARRSNQYRKIDTHLVYENEHFRQAPHLTPPFEHFPLIRDRGEIVAAYSYIVLKTGEESLEVMPVEELEAIRRRLPDRQKNSPAWRDYKGEMYRKLVLKRHLKRMPQSVELANAVEHSNQTEGHAEVHAAPARQISTRPSGPDRLAARLGMDALPPPEIEVGPSATPEPIEPPASEGLGFGGDEDDLDAEIMATEGGREG